MLINYKNIQLSFATNPFHSKLGKLTVFSWSICVALQVLFALGIALWFDIESFYEAIGNPPKMPHAQFFITFGGWSMPIILLFNTVFFWVFSGLFSGSPLLDRLGICASYFFHQPGNACRYIYYFDVESANSALWSGAIST